MEAIFEAPRRKLQGTEPLAGGEPDEANALEGFKGEGRQERSLWSR